MSKKGSSTPRRTYCTLLSLSLISVFFLTSCREEPFEVDSFDPLNNYSNGSDTISFELSAGSQIDKGLQIPNPQSEEQFLKVSFKVRNNSESSKKYAYKVFYQNESYKHLEYVEVDEEKKYNRESADNFYGSWDDNSKVHFTPEIDPNSEWITIHDSIRIIGNPRNENRFYGRPMKLSPITEKELKSKIGLIRSNESWLQDIQSKAVAEKRSEEEQLRLDALWSINYDRDKLRVNNRWQRNPRVGHYSFMLMIVEEKDTHAIPNYVQDISLPDTSGGFMNPYFFAFHAEHDRRESIGTLISKRFLKAKFTFDPSKGIYIGPKPNSKESLVHVRDEEVFRKAHFTQFFHSENEDQLINNVPIAMDIQGDEFVNYSYLKGTLVDEENWDHIRISKDSGSTVSFNTRERAIEIKNPGYAHSGELKKENVGVNTRIGLSYGKVTAKIKFPEMVNETGYWNGLTCAFWLINQENADWNNRKSCSTGYIPKYVKGESKAKRDQLSYSEIDIEIVNTNKHWPRTSYSVDSPYVFEEKSNSDIVIASTNWDMACRDAINYSAGAKNLIYDDQTFEYHRWDHWYKALTIKNEIIQKDILGKECYYQIEWKPNEIIWRAGTDLENLRVIGYMNEDQTSIPNNQMLAVITQEFHLDDWWPMAPICQSETPYPEDDITGYVYEIIWE